MAWRCPSARASSLSYPSALPQKSQKRSFYRRRSFSELFGPPAALNGVGMLIQFITFIFINERARNTHTHTNTHLGESGVRSCGEWFEIDFLSPILPPLKQNQNKPPQRSNKKAPDHSRNGANGNTHTHTTSSPLESFCAAITAFSVRSIRTKCNKVSSMTTPEMQLPMDGDAFWFAGNTTEKR